MAWSLISRIGGLTVGFMCQSWTPSVEMTEQWTVGPKDITAHWGLQSISGTLAEEEGQNKLDNYPS